MKEQATLRIEDQVRLLQRENDLLNSIIQGASDSIYAKDLEGRYITINQAGADYFGCSIEEVIGRTDADIMGIDIAKDFTKYDQRVFETGASVTYESRGLFGKGHAYFSTSKSALKDVNGQVIGLIGVSRDVTNARLSEEKYRFIFENAPISFWEENFSKVNLFFDELRANGVTDLRRYFRKNPDKLEHCIDLIEVENVNRTTLNMYGVADKTAFISKIHRNFTPESESIFEEEFIALFERKTFFQAEGSFVNMNGDTLDVQFILNVLPGHEQDLSLVLISIVDVTDTNQLASELSTIKHRYQSIVETQTEMICRIDSNGKIQFKNGAFARFFDFKDKGENARFVTLFPPEGLESCENLMEALSASRPTAKLELRNYDRNGDLVWQEWSITSFFGNSGVLLGYQAVGTDVTERKMAQEKLAASEARWRSVFEHADDLVMTVNSDGYILSVNDYVEIPKNEKWAGRTINDVMIPENAHAAMEIIGEVFASGKALKTEFNMLRKDGGEVATYGVALSPIFYGNRVITVICIARNITETKRLEKQTREILIEGQEKERMRVSQELHDGLGQLFTGIKLNMQQLRAELESDSHEGTLEALDVLEQNIGLAISEVKNISRNLMPDVLWHFGLRPALEDLVEKIRSTTDIQLSLELVDVDVRFSPDLEKALFRISQELINNSIRHAEASHIYVQLINHQDSIVLMVEDDGVGFNPNDRVKGSGLKNIRSRAEVLEGHVEIDSAVGKGTVTTVEIPLNENENDPSSDS